METLPLTSVGQVEDFLKGTLDQGVSLKIASGKARYEWIQNVLIKTRYRKLKKKEKKIVLRYIRYLTGYSKSHIKHCVRKWKKGLLYWNPTRKRNRFPVTYFASDIALLIKTDTAHDHLSGEATRKILEREFLVFGKKPYASISHISSSSIYRIRKESRQYRSSDAHFFIHTKPVSSNIGIRRKPRPNGSPGYLRVDTVHQGDLGSQKGVYHINIVDEVLQWEMISSVERISELYLRPVIVELLSLFPFVVFEFHSDNGSEYINRVTAELLNKLHIELTKSRSRHSNDNALVESKNGSIIRKHYGRNYISAGCAKKMSVFSKKYLNPYLNYHRPCGFATDVINTRGKVVKKYETWMTPYERLKSLPNAKKYLKEGFTFEKMEVFSKEQSDNECAEEMMKAKEKLFTEIRLIDGRKGEEMIY